MGCEGIYMAYTNDHLNYYKFIIPLEFSNKNHNSMKIEYDNINNIIGMLNSPDKTDVELALGIMNNLDTGTMEYSILIYRLMGSSNNWALHIDNEKNINLLLRRMVY